MSSGFLSCSWWLISIQDLPSPGTGAICGSLFTLSQPLVPPLCVRQGLVPGMLWQGTTSISCPE